MKVSHLDGGARRGPCYERRGKWERKQGRLSIPTERLLSEERQGEASYPCPWLHRRYRASTHAGAARSSWAPSRRGTSPCPHLPVQSSDTQLIPHDLGIKKNFFLKHCIIRPEPGRITTWSCTLFPGNRHHRSSKVPVPSSLTGQVGNVHLLHPF